MFTVKEAESIGEAYLSLKPNFVGDGAVKSFMDMVISMLLPGPRIQDIPKA